MFPYQVKFRCQRRPVINAAHAAWISCSPQQLVRAKGLVDLFDPVQSVGKRILARGRNRRQLRDLDGSIGVFPECHEFIQVLLDVVPSEVNLAEVVDHDLHARVATDHLLQTRQLAGSDKQVEHGAHLLRTLPEPMMRG